MTTVALLQQQLDDAYRFIRSVVDGLTDEEFFWEPVPGSWTVRRGQNDRWSVDYAEPDPVPPPFTTIGWRLVHVAECKLMYHEYAFGPATLTWPEIDSVHSAADAIAQLEEGHRRLVADLAGLNDADLDVMRLTNWGERWPAWRIFWRWRTTTSSTAARSVHCAISTDWEAVHRRRGGRRPTPRAHWMSATIRRAKYDSSHSMRSVPRLRMPTSCMR